MEQFCLALLCHRVNVAVWSSLGSIILCWIFALCPFSSSLYLIFWSEPEPCNSWVELIRCWSEIEVVWYKFTSAELLLLPAHHKVICVSLLLWVPARGLSLLPPNVWNTPLFITSQQAAYWYFQTALLHPYLNSTNIIPCQNRHDILKYL